MIFEKASTRTRVSFEAGMYQMGGSVVNLTTDRQPARPRRAGRGHGARDQPHGRHRHDPHLRAGQDRGASPRNSRVPVINGLTNEYHPCQILADVFTCIEQRGSDRRQDRRLGRRRQQHGDTWLQAADILGFTLHVSTPNGYEVDAAAGRRHATRLLQGLHATRSTPAAAPTSSPPTSGPAWATRPRTPSA